MDRKGRLEELKSILMNAPPCPDPAEGGCIGEKCEACDAKEKIAKLKGEIKQEMKTCSPCNELLASYTKTGNQLSQSRTSFAWNNHRESLEALKAHVESVHGLDVHWDVLGGEER